MSTNSGMSRRKAQEINERLESFAGVLLGWLDERIDKRLVRTFIIPSPFKMERGDRAASPPSLAWPSGADRVKAEGEIFNGGAYCNTPLRAARRGNS